MILVTGAAGKTGRALLRALAEVGKQVRALVRRPEQAELLRDLGVEDVIVGDMRDASALREAASDVQALYHICPNMHPEEIPIGRLAIDAARSGGIQRFVYHSVLHPQIEAMPHHWQKMRVEEMLFGSGLSYTILQPAAYMQNILGQWDQIVLQGIYTVPYSIQTQLGMVDLEDVAEAAVAVLSGAMHVGATYELSGSEALTQVELAAILGRELGRPVRAVCQPLSQWRDQAAHAGLGDYQLETLSLMFGYYEKHGFQGNPNVLNWLLGRPPTGFAAFVRRVIAAEHGPSDDGRPG